MISYRIYVQFYDHEKMVQNMMFVSHSPLKKRIVSVLDKHRNTRHSTTDESIYALTVSCCGEPPPGTGGVQ